MSKSPLNLYQVLIEEYNSQTNRPCLPNDFIPTKLAELGKQKRFAAITNEAERQRELNDAMSLSFTAGCTRTKYGAQRFVYPGRHPQWHFALG